MVSKTGLFVIFILMFSSLIFAQETQRVSFLPDPQLGGLNTSVSPLILNPRHLITATNLLYDHVGSRKKRGGIEYLNESSMSPLESSGSNTVMGVFDFRKIDSAGTETRKLLTHCDGKIYKMDAFDGTWDNISSGPLTIDKQADYAILRQVDTTVDTVVMVNSAEIPQTWNQDASTVDDLTGYPLTYDTFTPAYIETHKNRLWAAGVPSYPYRVYYSAGYKWNDWNTANDAGYIDIIDSWGSKVTGLASYFGYLIVFTENSIQLISGTTYADFVSEPLIIGIGAINNASVVSHGNDIYFVSRKGLHSLSTTEKYGDILETYLSAPIQNIFNNLRMNRLENCCGVVWPPLNYIIWSFTESGRSTNNICLVYDYLGKRWSKWDSINASCFAVVQNNSNEEVLVAGNYDGFVNKLNQNDYNDNDSAIEMVWTTPYISFDDPIISKNFQELFMYMKPQGDSEFTIAYKIDDETSETLTFSQEGGAGTFGTFLFGVDQFGGGSLLPRSQSLAGSGKTIQFTCTQDGLNEGCEVYGFALEFILGDVDYSN